MARVDDGVKRDTWHERPNDGAVDEVIEDHPLFLEIDGQDRLVKFVDLIPVDLLRPVIPVAGEVKHEGVPGPDPPHQPPESGLDVLPRRRRMPVLLPEDEHGFLREAEVLEEQRAHLPHVERAGPELALLILVAHSADERPPPWRGLAVEGGERGVLRRWRRRRGGEGESAAEAADKRHRY